MKLISNKKACLIASYWHGGQWSALYQFCSSGVIVEANKPDYHKEIEADILNTTTVKDSKQLNQLSNYIIFSKTVKRVKV
jgi:hypothetical protein